MWGTHCNCRMTQGMGLAPRTDWERGKAESWKGPPSTSIMRDTMTTKGFALRREFICTWRKTGAGDVVLSFPSSCRPRTRDKARVCVCAAVYRPTGQACGKPRAAAPQITSTKLQEWSGRRVEGGGGGMCYCTQTGAARSHTRCSHAAVTTHPEVASKQGVDDQDGCPLFGDLHCGTVLGSRLERLLQQRH